MTHSYTNYLIVRDDYFKNPLEIIELSKHLDYNKANYYPGERTENLLELKQKHVKEFADWFANSITIDIFPNTSKNDIFLYFHRYFPNIDPYYNRGFIHSDSGSLAGLVYLTPGEHNLNTGTSIFDNKSLPFVEPLPLKTDAKALEEFNVNHNITSDYQKGFDNNLNIFESGETIRIGNKFNRLIAYDSKLWHRANSFSTSINETRLSLLFFKQFDVH